MHFFSSLRSLGPRYFALWVGQTISQFGTYVAVITIPLLVYHIQGLTGDEGTLHFGLVYAAETVPTLLVGLVGGVMLDRVPLRPVMVAADLLRACAFFYLAAGVDEYGIGTLFAIAFIVGSMTTVFDGAMYALLPALVPKERLSDANSYVTASIQANFAIGPLVGGFLAAVTKGPAVGLLINGLTFVISAATLSRVGRVAHSMPADRPKDFVAEFSEGMRRIWDEPRLRISTLSAAIPNFVVGFLEATFVVMATVVLGTQTETEIGVLLFFMGLGGLIGAVYAPRFTRVLGLGRAMVIGLAVAGLCLLSVMFLNYGPVAMALLAAFMLGVSIINIPLATIRQIYAGEGMLGRVITASRALGWATLPLGALVGAWLGNTEEAYPWVARLFPLILVACAVWLFTTIIWSDTFGPQYRRGLHEAPSSRPGSLGGAGRIEADVTADEAQD